MMTAAQNERLTQVGKGTPGGTLLRQYWQPVALLDELEGDRPIKAVKLLGEHFVVFRDDTGRYGMLDRDCPHRGADLAFGRLEDGGVRCLFHGWLFDVQGNCIDTPAEPAGSKLCTRVKQAAYPVVEKSGMLFAYIGGGEPPAFPAFDCFIAPDAYTFAFKGFLDCN
ncbi:MAG: aromatic ring-hydroxylating dioxygenase subunit alpha, partial [Proteobacteria bacterium]